MSYTLLLIVALLVGVYFAIQQEDIQNWLTQKVTKKLSAKLGTEVKVAHIKIDFFNHLNLQGVYIADLKKDTLLYAGQLQFHITDWFFIKKQKPVISYVGLSDAILNLNRTQLDSVWNYGFIIDSFNTKSTSAVPKTASSEPSNNDTSMAFDLQKVSLNNIQFNSIDKWAGENIIAKVDGMELDARKIDWKTKWIDIASITFDETKIIYEDYIGGKPKRVKIDTIDTTPFNPNHWRITLDKFAMNNSQLLYNKDFGKPTPNVFDEEHLLLNNINLDLEKLVIIDDTLTSKIHQLQATDRCGFQIKDLQANAKISPISSRLDNLLLVTNNSTIRDYYEMQYTRFPDFQDYINKVLMKANFKKSNISFKDIAFFAPEVNQLTVKNVIINSGSALGTVANIMAKDINMQVGKSSLVGNLSMRGLPDINKTFIELESKNLQTSGPELITFIPSANTTNVAWRDLNNINFKGKYKGYIQDFVTDGTLTTNLGAVATNIHMTFLRGSQPTYSGFFSTTNLQLGRIIKQDIIGNLSAKGNIDGSGFDLDNLHTNFKGDIKSIETKNYTYQNIKVDGEMHQRKFEGKINSNDPNIAMNFDGQFDFSTSNPDFKLKTQLVHFDLQALGLSTQPINGSAYMDLNFKGNSLDNFFGKAKLYNVHVNNGNKKIFLDSAILVSTPIGNNKSISIRSSAMDANLTGNFTIANLPDAMQYYLSNYLPNYIAKPKNVLPQQFAFDIHTKQLEPIIQTFMKNINGCNDAQIAGAINMFNQNLTLNVTAPSFKIDNYAFADINMKGIGNYDSLNINGTTGQIFMGDQEIIPSAAINTTLFFDTAIVNIRTAGGVYNVKNANIQAKGFAKNNKLFLNILPSSFYFNQSKWDLNTSDYVVFEKVQIDKNNKASISNKITLGKLTLISGLQKIELQTEGLNEQNIVAHVQNIDIAEISKFSEKELELEGRINGDIAINNYLSNPAYSGNITTTEIKFKGDTLGQLIANVDYDNLNSLITINNSSGLLYNGNKTTFYGTINVKEKNPYLDLHTQINNANLKTFENFFTGFIENTKGTANGNIDIKGPANDYSLEGIILIKDMSTKVVYLGTTYTIPNGKVVINEKDIDLGKIKLYDQLGNIANLSGHIYHDHFNDLRFGKEFGDQNPITVTSRKFQFLNTSSSDNGLYYGTVIAKGTMFLSGPLDNLYMEILDTTLAGSKLTIPIRGSYDNSQYDFIKYKSYGQEENITTKVVEKNRLMINLSIQATPEAEMRILMDPSTGEEIVGKGNGFITMQIDLNNNIKMNGDYTISQGTYGYTFRNIIKKDLTITPGGTISWNGDPLAANLSLEANYITTASLQPLLGSDAANATKEEKIQYPTYVNIQLSGPMLTPTIKYDISQPNNNDVTSLAYYKLKELKSNDQKLIAQVGSLILTNQFLNTETSSDNTGIASSTILNTLNGVVSNTLSSILTQNISKWLGVKNFDVTLDYKNAIDSIGSGSVHQFNYTIRKSYLNNRMTIEIGDNINTTQIVVKSAYTAIPNDFKLKYLLNPEGRTSVNFFRTSFTDITSTSQDSKTGIGLSYRKSFNNFNELLKRNIIVPAFVPEEQDSMKGNSNN